MSDDNRDRYQLGVDDARIIARTLPPDQLRLFTKNQGLLPRPDAYQRGMLNELRNLACLPAPDVWEAIHALERRVAQIEGKRVGRVVDGVERAE